MLNLSKEFNAVNLRCYLLFLQHRVSDQLTHTATVTSKALTVDSKTSNSECDWSNLQTSIFKFGSCDTQGVKNNR